MTPETANIVNSINADCKRRTVQVVLAAGIINMYYYSGNVEIVGSPDRDAIQQLIQSMADTVDECLYEESEGCWVEHDDESFIDEEAIPDRRVNYIAKWDGEEWDIIAA